MELILLIAGLGFLVSIASGMLGIGGGILMAPALLYLPSLLGLEDMPMHTIAGLTITQSVAASAVASIQHRRRGYVDTSLVLWMAVPLALASLAGGLASPWASAQLLKILFAVMALVGAGLMSLPPGDEEEGPKANRALVVCIALIVGAMGGAVGQGGSFLLIPLMIHLLRVPTRIAIGSNLGIVLLGSTAGFTGKLATGQLQWSLATGLVAGAVLGAWVGSRVGHSFAPDKLRKILGAVVALGAIAIAADALR
ncbi:MAG: sulfite exporter TauE/SafE family protein [Kofleriaceae bacterium]|nr:sulfite exporter TauE/SafE family protein [Kofleriaceae bacterium]